MDEDIYRQLAERLRRGERGALAMVVRTWGSTPQRAGAKAVFTPDGAVIGTIGGGCLEHEARLAALDALHDHRPRRVEVDLTHDYDQATGLICGGRALIVIALPAPADAALFERLSAAQADQRVAALAVGVSADEHLGALALADDRGADGRPTLAAVAAEGLATRQPGLRPNGAGEAFVDVVLPRPWLWIAGAGHVGRAVARHAVEVGFAVAVVDDRPDLNSPGNIPWAETHLVGEIETLLGARQYGPDDYVVIVTRGHQHDADALRAVVRSDARYLGLIGSRRKIKLLREGLVEEGAATEADLARVFAPIGLDIGAVTVDEIAVCIVAELIAVRRGRLRGPAERRSDSERPSSGGACPA